jgi:predicted component of type VI protein secretion system
MNRATTRKLMNVQRIELTPQKRKEIKEALDRKRRYVLGDLAAVERAERALDRTLAHHFRRLDSTEEKQ